MKKNYKLYNEGVLARHNEKHKKEIVYVAQQLPWFLNNKEICKIGKTTFDKTQSNSIESISNRVESLNNSSIRDTERFMVVFAYVSLSNVFNEKSIHKIFKYFRESKNREFFLLKPKYIFQYIIGSGKEGIDFEPLIDYNVFN